MEESEWGPASQEAGTQRLHLKLLPPRSRTTRGHPKRLGVFR